MGTLAEVVKLAAEEASWWRPKYAKVSLGPDKFFVHLQVPDDVARKLLEVQRRVLPAGAVPQEIDHVTLVHVPSFKDSDTEKKILSPDRVHRAVEALKAIGDQTEPIKAKVQGWAYFDGAMKDGQPKTALVALLDAPGLEALHVDMVRALKDVGIPPSDRHGFTPHVTFGYLEHRTRADAHLEPLHGEFTVDKVHVANDALHEIPLSGVNLGEKAASWASGFEVSRR